MIFKTRVGEGLRATMNTRSRHPGRERRNRANTKGAHDVASHSHLRYRRLAYQISSQCPGASAAVTSPKLIALKRARRLQSSEHTRVRLVAQ